ncbi:hypothetical protein [Bacillus velezensis]|uniref:hypothetical protein n=1 Tax=Bacillus velezensis TaxID=492670 RepID=UPI001E379C75|nr:hypothetical protein [Bacillus velezensis]GJJ26777.1 hypothetical protein BVN1_25410 [Bacillus velezensis]
MKSAETYKRIVIYTKAKYEVTTKIFIRKFEPTKTKTWISEADPNIDSVEPNKIPPFSGKEGGGICGEVVAPVLLKFPQSSPQMKT